MKIKIIFVFSGIVAIWVLSFLIHLYERKDSFKIEDINIKNIDSIKIFDRGIVGENSFFIRNKDSINGLVKIISNSKGIDEEKLNLEDSNGVCDLMIYSENRKPTELNLTATNETGGIVNSGDYYYRNDELLHYVRTIFKK
jgi:hypothetical protein